MKKLVKYGLIWLKGMTQKDPEGLRGKYNNNTLYTLTSSAFNLLHKLLFHTKLSLRLESF